MWKKVFDLFRAHNLLQEAWDASHDMLEVDREMLLEAIRVLRESDEAEVNQEIRAKDKQVNQYERDVRRMVMTHCTVRGATELPSGMVLISIVMDIERIGDYTKTIMDLAVAHPRRLMIPEAEDQLQAIESTIKDRFTETIDVLEAHDEERARTLLSTYKEEVPRAADSLVNSILAGEISSLSAPDAAAAVLYVRYLRRIGAHLKNVTTSVVNPFEWIGYGKVKSVQE
jgi:phosphate transport system protein